LLIQKQDEKEGVLQERFINKKELVEREWDEIDLQLEEKVEWHLDQEIQ